MIDLLTQKDEEEFRNEIQGRFLDEPKLVSPLVICKLLARDHKQCAKIHATHWCSIKCDGEEFETYVCPV